MNKVYATASRDVFLQAKHPPRPAELRMKTWRWLVAPISADDPTWSDRCKRYWKRQERIYGMILSDFTMLIDWDGGFISTYATVLAVVPGERSANKANVTFLQQAQGELA